MAQAVAEVDLVLDCSDNFPTRHAVNRARGGRKPLFSGSAIRFGQIAVFTGRRGGPCYRCLFPEEAEIQELRCAVMGVFALLTGLIGTALAAEAIKWLAGLGAALSGRLVLFDALTMQWRSLERGARPLMSGLWGAGAGVGLRPAFRPLPRESAVLLRACPVRQGEEGAPDSRARKGRRSAAIHRRAPR